MTDSIDTSEREAEEPRGPFNLPIREMRAEPVPHQPADPLRAALQLALEATPEQQPAALDALRGLLLPALQSLQGVELPEPHIKACPAFVGALPDVYTADQLRTAVAAALGRGAVPQGEPSRPDILERLTYHALERDDLTLDDCLSYLAKGWCTVPGRTERQMVLQILALLSAAPSPEATQPEPCKSCNGEGGHEKALSSTNYTWVKCPDCEGTCKATQPTQAEAPSEREALSVIAAFPITDEKNMDAVNMRDVARRAVVRAALATQQAGQGEVVAWIANDTGYNYVQWKENINWPVGTKFYTTPPAPQQPEALAQQEREPMTDAQIEKLREATFSTNNPFCPVDSKSMRKAVRAAESFHRIRAARSREGDQS